MAQTGDYSIGDPHDYCQPAATVFGICFDYAQAAYDYIADNRASYEAKGMKRGCWYIAGTGNNSRRITLYDPASREQAAVILNGAPLKENSRQNVQAPH
jgi:hypothetical protein